MSAIWHAPVSLESANRFQKDTIAEVLDIRITAFGDDYIEGTMPVDHRTRQPMGILHGGASVVLAESLGSLAANLVVDSARYYCVGLDINANHVRGVRAGVVTGRARPWHLGSSTQVWEIVVQNEAKKPICVSRLTMAVLAHARSAE